MTISKKPYFVQTVLQIENTRIRISANENIYAVGDECISSTHNHSFFEMRYFASGSGEIVIGDDRMNIGRGDIYIIHPSEYHYQNEYSLSDDVSQYSISFSPIAPPADAPVTQRKAYDTLMEVLSALHHISDTELSLIPYFERLKNEISLRGYGHVNCVSSLLTVIMTDILRWADMRDKKGRLSHPDDIFLSTDAFFSKRYSEKVSLSDYAAHLNISPRHASRIIRKNFGISFTEKLTETRIEKAKFKLCHSNKSIISIAAECGFQSYGYFVTCFKKHTGSPPTVFRKEHCKE